MDKPWLELNPYDFVSCLWITTNIIDRDSLQICKMYEDVICYFIIQIENMTGIIFWRIAIWYKNDKNRYCRFIYNKEWFFNKNFNDMKCGEVVYSIINPNIKFKVNLCKFIKDNKQNNFCKILERII